MRHVIQCAVLSLVFLATTAHGQVYRVSITPIGTYDSRWDGANYDPIGTNGYIRDVNGAPVMIHASWQASYDTIWSQASVDVFFETQQNLDLNSFTGVNVLNFQTVTEESAYFNGTNAGLEAVLDTFLSTTGSSETHYSIFVNSYSNGTPINSDLNNPSGPLSGGLASFSASGLARRPNPGNVTNMRFIMATGDGITAANESQAFLSNPSSLPSVLAHELGHNASLPHINATTSSEHYDPARTNALLWTGGGSSGSENVLSAGEVADALRTMEANGTLALVGGNTGTFWDTNSTTSGFGGSGTWDGSATNWGRPSGTGTSGTWVGSEVAVFRGSGSYTVTVSGNQAATGIAVQVGNPTFTGGTITLTNAKASVDGVPEIFVESSRTVTMDSVVAGGGSEALTKLGAGTLVLNNTGNTYTGGTQVRRGTLEGNAASIRGNVQLVNGSDATISTVLHFNQSTNGTFTGTITGSGDELRKSGSGTLTLTSATLSYTGATMINDGLLNIDGTKSSSDSVTVGASGAIGGTGSITGDTTINGAVDLRNGSAGLLTFVDDVTYDSAATTYFEFSAAGQVDSLDVGGLLTLDGAFAFTNLGYSFAFNDTFDLLDWGTSDFSGFDVVNDLEANLPALGGGLSWTTSNFASLGQIQVVPEPSGFALMGVAGVVGLGYRRLRRSLARQ